MEWKEILTLLVPTFAFLGWIYHRLDKKFDGIDKKFDGVYKKLDSMSEDIKSISKDLHNVDMRLNRLEGRFEERGYWETREWRKTGTDHKK